MYEPHLASADFGGVGIRLLALLADTAIVVLLTGLIVAGAAAYLGEAALPLAALAAGLLAVLYWPALHASPLQATFGKAMLGLRITGYQGERVSFLRSLGRELAKLLSGALLMIGYLMAAFTARKQALHDMLAWTYVVREGKARTAAALVTVVAGFVLPAVALPLLLPPATMSSLIATVSGALSAALALIAGALN